MTGSSTALGARRLRALLAAARQQVFRAGAEWSSLQALSRDGIAWEAAVPRAAWLERHVAPEDHDRLLRTLSEAERQGAELDLEITTALSFGGTGRAHLRAVRFTDGQAAPAEWWAILRDVGVDPAAGPHRELAERQRRIRNTLALVRSTIRRSAATSSAAAQAFAMHLEGRVDALIRVQVALARASEAGLDLEALLRDELTAAGAAGGAVSIEGSPLLLPPAVAEALAMAFHELTTNSIKFGALSGRGDGRIEVAWDVAEGTGAGGLPQLRFRWTERTGHAGRVPRRRGFGTELLERTLTYSLGATAALDHGPDGMSYVVVLPLRWPGRAT